MASPLHNKSVLEEKIFRLRKVCKASGILTSVWVGECRWKCVTEEAFVHCVWVFGCAAKTGQSGDVCQSISIHLRIFLARHTLGLIYGCSVHLLLIRVSVQICVNCSGTSSDGINWHFTWVGWSAGSWYSCVSSSLNLLLGLRAYSHGRP